ncbi:3-methylmercaptopropionyl-CoA dehydrogenase [Georgfuchsia toluolica]|uniref:3-methylmercaptopropionyl-CoA dehydrogenase n=1 Tax=Georgfuchsia toluolica TaxID=424218 RepID=A0A916J6S4_9PROT|nr:acyl-CoA dehydrogenase family protein [Georgfuchsia toluolica]CAG4885271.1 3-methylmercaptopropionyl-CoA dehydrogenase [Georgfuchsia toluolica]
MADYTPPLRDMRFILEDMGYLGEVAVLPGQEEITADVTFAILEEAGKFAAAMLAPLNRSGDREGCRLQNNVVTTPKGWKDAYAAYREAGWTGVAGPQEFGGQNLAKIVATPLQEMWQSANLAFSLLPLLSFGAIDALLRTASTELKHKYLPKMIDGTWSGTMNLTEPQAGSDLGAVRTRAEPQPDGSYRISGQKIFITYGEHDCTENIIHLVLARLPDAPPGVKGISLFVVPKFLVNADGSLGARNDVKCVSIEHKLGIHASPTCVMAYGDEGGAVGHLVGSANRGLEHMFVMMNEARFSVGLQGIAVAERSYQQALAYARERIQGHDAVSGEHDVAIIRHPDVRRMLLLMKSRTQAARMLAYAVAAQFDRALHHADAEARKQSQALVDLLIPVVKAWSTEIGNESVQLGVQIHGGMGFIEETGAAQHLRDARILTIYEGTTGIQALDLLGRKLARDGGESLKLLIGTMLRDAEALAAAPLPEAAALAPALKNAIDTLGKGGHSLLVTGMGNMGAALGVAVPFLHLTGVVCGAWQWGRATTAAAKAIQAGSTDADYYRSQIALAQFYFSHVASSAAGLAQTVAQGGSEVSAFPDQGF